METIHRNPTSTCVYRIGTKDPMASFESKDRVDDDELLMLSKLISLFFFTYPLA